MGAITCIIIVHDAVECYLDTRSHITVPHLIIVLLTFAIATWLGLVMLKSHQQLGKTLALRIEERNSLQKKMSIAIEHLEGSVVQADLRDQLLTSFGSSQS